MNQVPVKKIAAIHDLSGFGRAALSSIIPIISTMGVQVCSVPTAILSTHTGDFEDYTFIDLTEHMESYLSHWHKMNLWFDCVYTGFLGSAKQIDIISNYIQKFEEKPLVVIDPVMADDGSLYSTMDYNMVESMRKFIGLADVITPNFTEAAFLLGKNISTEILSDQELKEWLVELSKLGPETVIITSVPHDKRTKKTYVVAYNKKDDRFWRVDCVYIPTQYPGTGDAFTSVLVGSLLQGDSLPMALDRSVQFVTSAIRASYGYDYPNREGVLVEKVLDTLKLPVMLNSYELF